MGGGGATQYNSRAFTLAEAIITLGIVGIVAAMTLPTVIQKIQDKQFKTAFKKQYSVIAQALQLIYAETGQKIELNDWNESPYYMCLIGEKLKAKQSGLKCKQILQKPLGSPLLDADINRKFSWHSNNTWFDKRNKSIWLNSSYQFNTFILPDGAMINFNCSTDFFIDVNGYKKPNVTGRDIFYFRLPASKNNIAPEFFDSNGIIHVNGCTTSGFYQVTKDTYKEDCLSGSGWGCSPLYIIN